MTNMSVHNGTRTDIDLDIIQEYIVEDTSLRPQFVLPGPPLPPPPPPDPDSDSRTLQKLTSPKRNAVLVPRGTASQPLRTFPEIQSTVHHPMRSSRGSAPRSGCGRGGAAAVQRAARSDTEPLERLLDKPQLVVTEQPKERGMRFRYECEGRSAGSILGTSSNETNKTLPAIEIQGPIQEIKNVTVTVSLVTKDIPYRPHPHCLVGKDCSDGICVIHLNPHNTRRHSFANLGIQCVRRKELDLSLKKRRDQKIDPFNTGQSKSIEDMDMNVVRLCFQCELEREDGERIHLSPIVSNPIFDKKATTTSELKITRLNIVKGPCTGKTEIYMLCDKVQKDDIEIIFGRGSWEAKAEFAQTDVHRQIAIVFKSPPYQDQDIYEEVDVNVFLRRLSDRMDSEPVKFTYTAHNPDPYGVNRKRKIKPDIKFTDGCNARAESVMAEPAVPRVFDSYSYPLESSVGMVTPSQEDLPIQPVQALGDMFAVDELKQEDPIETLDPDTMNMLSSIIQMLEDSGSASFGLPAANQDENSNFRDVDSFLMEDPSAMNMSIYTDMQFNQMVSGGHHAVAPSVLDLIEQGLAEGHGLPQVKTEKDGDV
ncbi:transcription factor RelB isoform X2 [Alosa sapidissima]|uniref:transcription factor RelB isoform X2 n=1 Tax=Alosa sapidissima TaxID=34773 RepID=UPI001C086D26|nr:transcription factor RelB isoform X2 [Alosa sapidissima]